MRIGSPSDLLRGLGVRSTRKDIAFLLRAGALRQRYGMSRLLDEMQG
jgi:hypothetical protein